MNICGVLIHANPQKFDGVVASLRELRGVEIHMSVEDSARVVVTIEDTPQVAAIDSLTAIHKLEGVVSAALIYHNFEPAETAAVHN